MVSIGGSVQPHVHQPDDLAIYGGNEQRRVGVIEDALHVGAAASRAACRPEDVRQRPGVVAVDLRKDLGQPRVVGGSSPPDMHVHKPSEPP